MLAAGLFPNVIVAPRDLGGKTVGDNTFKSLKGDVNVHPCSLTFRDKELYSRYCVYHEIVKTSKIYVRDVNPISPLALCLFGGSLAVYQEKGVVSIADWLRFRVAAKPATLIKHLRSQMEEILLEIIINPGNDTMNQASGRALVKSVSLLLEAEEANIKKIKSEGGGGRAAAMSFFGGGGRGGGDSKPGDWVCPKCGVNNFASRSACFKCGEAGGGGGRGQGGRGQGGGRGGGRAGRGRGGVRGGGGGRGGRGRR